MPHENELVEIHAIVKGRVQGVGFRATVQHYAKSLGLNGTVANLPDETVEIYLSGPRHIVDTFLKNIRTEARFAEIREIATKEISPPRSYQGFRVTY